MFNIFKRHRTKFKKNLEESRKVLEIISILEDVENNGLIKWNAVNRQLLISSTLASIMLRNAESWNNFCSNIVMWMTYKEANRMWEEKMVNAADTAVKQAARNNPHMSKAETISVRQKAREDIALTDCTLGPQRPWDFFIIDTSSTDKEDKPMIAIGHYEDGKSEMALWEDISYQFGLEEKQ